MAAGFNPMFNRKKFERILSDSPVANDDLVRSRLHDYRCANQRANTSLYSVPEYYDAPYKPGAFAQRGTQIYEKFDAVLRTEGAKVAAEKALLLGLGGYLVPSGSLLARLKETRHAWDLAMLKLKEASEAEELAIDAWFDTCDAYEDVLDDKVAIAHLNTRSAEKVSYNAGKWVKSCYDAHRKALAAVYDEYEKLGLGWAYPGIKLLVIDLEN